MSDWFKIAEAAIVGACLVAALTVLCGSILYGCTSADEQARAVQRTCIEAGGSWVPTMSGGACIAGRRP